MTEWVGEFEPSSTCKGSRHQYYTDHRPSHSYEEPIIETNATGLNSKPIDNRPFCMDEDVYSTAAARLVERLKEGGHSITVARDHVQEDY